MKLKLVLFGCLSAGIGLGTSAQQINNSTQQDTQIWGLPLNTGIAIAPGFDVQAAVFDDGGGQYIINWIESATNNVVDQEFNYGNDPDVAYYVHHKSLAVAYENGGDIFIDEYKLSSLSPNPDYSLSNTIHVSSGEYPNIDIASHKEGVITWEDNGDIYASAYLMGNGVGPIVYVGNGKQPDAIATDDYDIGAITYINPAGELIIERFVFFELWAGNYNVVDSWLAQPNIEYEFPRIASERQQGFGGNNQNFAVVVQDYGPNGSAAVDGFFINNGYNLNPPVSVNTDFVNCGGDLPLPVVTYHLGNVRVVWSQYHPGGCASVSQNGTPTMDDVLSKDFDPYGNPITGDYEQVNQLMSGFNSYSRNAVSSEYDGAFSVNSMNYHSGVLYSDQGDLFWKGIYNGNATYMDESGITAERDNNFSLVTSPVDQTIEVLSESDDIATFEMLDNAGRVVELKTISNDGNVYSIDISHLSGGIYLLHCASNTSEEVLRILQVTK